MCRADIAPNAATRVAQLLGAMATALAERDGIPASDVRIGPVDFGTEPEHQP